MMDIKVAMMLFLLYLMAVVLAIPEFTYGADEPKPITYELVKGN